ncbi:MAG: class I SAM-dependent methyltransferase [Bacteroidetes bacterium]|nr:MAG: class I SAM-dependent methyltransferase [Bacteroidota bacterium]
MSDYYSRHLSADRLQRVYEIASPRVKQYFEAEISYAQQKIQPNDMVLELGCGYGRVLPSLAHCARLVVGIDTSLSSLMLGQKLLKGYSNCLLLQMDASKLSFLDATFDIVLCIQNGISAFHVDQRKLIQESIRVTKPGGSLLFSSYSEKFWQYRLEWFQRQSDEGLLGEIDYERTKNGLIVCKDGFTATTVTGEQFLALAKDLPVESKIIEVDDSCIVCEMQVYH